MKRAMALGLLAAVPALILPAATPAKHARKAKAPA